MVICKECEREFSSKEALEMHIEHKHMSKEEAKKSREGHQKNKRNQKHFFYLLGGVLLLTIGYLFFSNNSGGTYSNGSVHWHAKLSISVCGENVPLPIPKGGQTVHGKPFIGTPLMHLHGEPRIHIEGTVRSAEDISLGKFMQAVGIKFTDEMILSKKNGDLCDGESGEVKLLVNGIKNLELSNKVIRDKETYQIVFE